MQERRIGKVARVSLASVASAAIVIALPLRRAEAALPVCGGTGNDALTSAAPSPYLAANLGQDVTISGTAESDAVGVTIQLDGGSPQSTTLPGSSSQQAWSITVPASLFDGLPDGNVAVSGSVSLSGGSTVPLGMLGITKDTVPPGPVTSFTAIAGTGQVSLSWTNPTDADYSRTVILESTSGFATSPVASATQTVIYTGMGTSFVATGLAAVPTYFTAFAFDAAGNSSTPATAQATPTAPVMMAPGPVTSFLATAGTGQASLTWVNPTDASYAETVILESTSGFATTPMASSTQTIIYTGTGTSFVATGLAPVLTYFTAFALDSFGDASSPATSQATPTAPTSVSFSDSFAGCTSTSNLGSNWTINGRWYCAGQKARGETAAGTALAITSALTDTDVIVRIQLTGSATGSGVIARASNGSYYAAIGLAAGKVEIIRVSGGTTTVLGQVSASIPVEPGSFKIELQVTGSSTVQLVALLSGKAVLSVQDTSSSRLLSGQGGMLSGTQARTQYDTFSLKSL
jgi:hypothetical protein